MKFHMLMFMNAWMMLVLMKYKCQISSLTLGCYNVVDHGCDTHVESFVVRSHNIGQVGSSYKGRHALFLIFLSNIPYV